MPCEYQYQLIEFIRDEMDAVLDDPDAFTHSQLVDLINHWNYSLCCVLIYDYTMREHNKQFFRRMKAMQREIKKRLDEASPSDEESNK